MCRVQLAHLGCLHPLDSQKNKKLKKFNAAATFRKAVTSLQRSILHCFCFSTETEDEALMSLSSNTFEPEIVALDPQLWGSVPREALYCMIRNVHPLSVSRALRLNRSLHSHLKSNWSTLRRIDDHKVKLICNLVEPPFVATFDGPRAFMSGRVITVYVSRNECWVKRDRLDGRPAKMIHLDPSAGWQSLPAALVSILNRFEISSVYFRSTKESTILALQPLFPALTELRINGACISKCAPMKLVNTIIEKYAVHFVEMQSLPCHFTVLRAAEAGSFAPSSQLVIANNSNIAWTEEFLFASQHEALLLGQWPYSQDLEDKANPAMAMREWLELWYDGKKDDFAVLGFLNLSSKNERARRHFEDDRNLKAFLTATLPFSTMRHRLFGISYELTSKSGRTLYLLVSTDHFRATYAVLFFVLSAVPDSGPFYNKIIDDVLKCGHSELN